MNFREEVKKRVLLLDGAMGTNLIDSGVKMETLPDILNIENPLPVRRIFKSYLDAGSEIIRTNTFNTIRPKLRQFGFENRLYDLAIRGLDICRAVIKDKAFLAVSIGPSGELMYPFGRASFDEVYGYYYEIAKIYDAMGPDIFWLETFSDLYELKTAIIAIRDVSRLPIVALMTFDGNLRTVFGTTPQVMAATISRMEVDAIGANCSIGSQGILDVIAAMKGFTDLPLVAQPNAGIPVPGGERLCYPEMPSEMASYAKRFVENGVRIIGGCCGSNEQHIRRFHQELKGIDSLNFTPQSCGSLFLTSRSSIVEISTEAYPVIIGERINPTNKRHLLEALRGCDYSEFLREARIQIDAGADLLDINTGGAGIEEEQHLPSVVRLVISQRDIPISIDTGHERALQSAIVNVPGRCLINSVQDNSLLRDRLRLARRFGDAVIVLTLGENGIPEDHIGRINVAEKIIREAIDAGLDERDLIFDFLTLSAATSRYQIKETIKAIKEFKRLKRPTVLGVSNVSYGLPKRSFINSVFLSIAIDAGLSAAIMDPTDENVFRTFISASAICGYDGNFSRYINLSGRGGGAAKKETDEYINPFLRLLRDIIEGERENAVEDVSILLERHVDYKKIISEGILKAMKEVGNRFRTNQIFLPQVMLSAEAAQASFDVIVSRIGPHQKVEKKGRIVIATVEGDIHDLGKNLVAAVLRNSGFEVVDLGKNVKGEMILKSIKESPPDIIGLSALMTTTMGKMRDILQLISSAGFNIPVMVGGAVVNEEFARSIGAYYGSDAIEAVEVAERIMASKKDEI